MGISVSQLQRTDKVKKVVVHTIDMSLYLVSVVVEEEEHYITDTRGGPLKSHNAVELQSLLQHANIERAVLEQHCATGKHSVSLSAG